jgi:glycerol kinase
MSPFVVGIDQGTTATKAYRLGADGDFQQLCSIEHRQIYPQPGWVEHDRSSRGMPTAVSRFITPSSGRTTAPRM